MSSFYYFAAGNIKQNGMLGFHCNGSVSCFQICFMNVRWRQCFTDSTTNQKNTLMLGTRAIFFATEPIAKDTNVLPGMTEGLNFKRWVCLRVAKRKRGTHFCHNRDIKNRS